MDGESPEVVIKALGMSRARIYQWLAAYREGGFEALKAKQIVARIYFGDEASIRSDYHSGTTRAPIGETLVICNTGSRFSTNMIYVISPRGGLRFKTIEGNINTGAFTDRVRQSTGSEF